jgi:hypothetical protein
MMRRAGSWAERTKRRGFHWLASAVTVKGPEAILLEVTV